MPEVTLTQILQAREDRARQQQQLLNTYRCPLVSFTMNIAGPVKTSALIERAFHTGLMVLESSLPEENILFRCENISITGCQAMYAVNTDALALKKICTDIEDTHPLGRLFDMDVLDRDGSKPTRDFVGGKSRDCIVCGAVGRGCAAGRLHAVSQLQAATNAIISRYFIQKDAECISELAVQSLIDEVNTTPKPGLVDRRNNGSHKDMNISTFLASADSLRFYFQKCVNIGQETSHLSPAKTFYLLRQAGLAAEQTMLLATHGVNTHKGAVYTMGILCGSLGRLWTPEQPIGDTEKLLSECVRIAENAVKSDFAASKENDSAGLRLYHQQGLTGVRGEVAAGLPSVWNISLPAYKKALKAGLSSNDAGAAALLHLIAHVTDTNLYHRGGNEGASYAAQAARNLLKKGPHPSTEQIEVLDDAFIARNLSPGGCADLLAVTYFLYDLQIHDCYSSYSHHP